MDFADPVVHYVSLVALGVTVIVDAVAFVHCVTRRADAFPVVGRFPKSIWVLMTGAALVFTVLSGSTLVSASGTFGLLTGMVAIAAMVVALVYLLDIRPALRDVTHGGNNW
ncbi:MAG TPA: DUF2516 family protein [Micromonosporaceae bacterium]|jgi:hypothetical protein